MKKRVISLLLAFMLVAALVPMMSTDADAAQQITATPYTPVEYNYSSGVQAGTIRFVQQLTMSKYFYDAYWAPYTSYAGHECLTACVSMALSYVGVAATPAELGNYWNAKGYTGGVPFRTIQWDTAGFGGTYVKASLDGATANYLNGHGTYSPAVIHLKSYSQNGHWVMVVGKTGANSYVILDPASDTTWPLTYSNGVVNYQRNGTTRTEAISDETFQYYNPNVVVGQQVGFQTGNNNNGAKTHMDGAVCPTGAYTDVPEESNWAHAGIDYCVENGLMNGVDTTHFQPDAQMTRAMLVTVLYRASGSPNVDTSRLPFVDIAADWYRNAVAWAYTTGVTSGVSANRFNPNGTVTREQLVTMLYRFMCIQTGGARATDYATINGYADSYTVSDWAVNAMCWAVDSGIILGDGSNLQPLSNANRSQIAAILLRYSSQA